MPQMRGNALTGTVPQAKIVLGINRLFTVLIRDRQAATGGDGADILAEIDHLLHHGITHPLQMLVIHARTDMHMHTDQFQAVLLNFRHRLR
ncbi:hypothetical protein D3C78_1675560 [compost metagenome]